MTKHNPGVRVAAIAAISLTLFASAGCSAKSSGGTGGIAGVTTSTTPTLAPAPSSDTTAPTSAPSDTTTTATTSTETHTSKPGAPRIVSFKVTQKPECPIVPTSDAPFAKAGTDIKLSWKITGANHAALSQDAPNWFKDNHTGTIESDYDTTMTVELNFNCDPTVQPNTTHTYTLDTVGGSGAYAEKTLTVTVQTSP